MIIMGVFDSFIPHDAVICPNCNQEIKGPDVILSIKDGWVEAHTVCDKCKSYVQFKVIIENGIWTRTEKW